jgi:hypothetical protein
MARLDAELDRLLRSASGAENAPAEMPFGFDTRVVALWKSTRSRTNGFGFGRMLQRVALAAIVITVAAGGAAWWQAIDSNDSADSFASAYAIADTAIESGVLE